MVEMTEIRKGAVTRSFALARESTGALLPQSLSLKNVQVKRRTPAARKRRRGMLPRAWRGTCGATTILAAESMQGHFAVVGTGVSGESRRRGSRGCVVPSHKNPRG